MDRHDPFPRRTTSLPGLAPWLAELVRSVPGLVGSYVPGGGLDARSREQVILAVTEVNGCRYCAWIHGGWAEFLGEGDQGADEAMLAFARACAEAGRPLDPSPLAAVLPPEGVQALRATVAQIEIANLVGNTVDGLLARLTRKRPLVTPATLSDAVTVAAALPIAAPMLAAGALLRAVSRAAPPLPEVEQPAPGDANLLVHLLSGALPAWLSNAAVRMAVLSLPASVSIGVRAGRTAATVTVGRRAVRLTNGIARDAIVVLEGEVEPLLKLASGSLVRELGAVRLRPNQ